MPNVGAGKSGARRTIAIGIERPWIGAVLGALDVEPAIAGERRAVASHPRRRHAIEQVDATPDSLDEVLGETDAHQVAGLGLRQCVVDDFDHLVHRVLVFADREPADPEAGPLVHGPNGFRGLATQLRVDPTLDDREQRLTIARIVGRKFFAGSVFQRLALLESLYL